MKKIQIGEKSMSLIDENERNFLLKWARQKQNQDALDMKISENRDSYFKTCITEENYIMPYQFSTIKEIKECEQKVLGDDIGFDVSTAIAIAMLKNKPQMEKVTDVATKQDQIPEFIYVF